VNSRYKFLIGARTCKNYAGNYLSHLPFFFSAPSKNFSAPGFYRRCYATKQLADKFNNIGHRAKMKSPRERRRKILLGTLTKSRNKLAYIGRPGNHMHMDETKLFRGEYFARGRRRAALFDIAE